MYLTQDGGVRRWIGGDCLCGSPRVHVARERGCVHRAEKGRVMGGLSPWRKWESAGVGEGNDVEPCSLGEPLEVQATRFGCIASE